MSTYTLAQVQADIATTRTAINDILSNGQATSMDGRSFTAADLGDLREHLKWLSAEETRLTRGGIRGRRVVAKR